MYLNTDQHFEFTHTAKRRKKIIPRPSHSQLGETTMLNCTSLTG